MEKKKRNLIMIIAVVAVAVIAAAIGGVIAIKKMSSGTDNPGSGNESYREIQVYQLDGTAEVEREEIGRLDAYLNMQLQNKDLLRVFLESYLYLRMDEDKYGLLSPDTEILLEAEGTSENSKTKLTIQKGTFTGHIDKKLNADSSFEINTPNSTMAIRGTSFQVKVWYDENGEVYTSLLVFEGEIECHLVYPDGTVEPEAVFIKKGSSVLIHMDDVISEYLEIRETVDYTEMTREELEFLFDFDDEDIYSIPRDELEFLLYSVQVTFTYEGNIFGTQRILQGETPAVPSMQPTAKGHWDYDFTKTVTEDLKILWIAE